MFLIPLIPAVCVILSFTPSLKLPPTSSQLHFYMTITANVQPNLERTSQDS